MGHAACPAGTSAIDASPFYRLSYTAWIVMFSVLMCEIGSRGICNRPPSVTSQAVTSLPPPRRRPLVMILDELPAVHPASNAAADAEAEAGVVTPHRH